MKKLMLCLVALAALVATPAMVAAIDWFRAHGYAPPA